MRQQKRKMKKLKRFDAAYLAGLFDGEGCVHARAHGKLHRRVATLLSVCMCNENILTWIKHKTGCGSIRIHLPRKPHHSIAFEWVLASSVEGAALLKQLLPFLKEKRQQAVFYIQLSKLRENRYYPQGNHGRRVYKLEKQQHLARKITELKTKVRRHAA